MSQSPSQPEGGRPEATPEPVVPDRADVLQFEIAQDGIRQVYELLSIIDSKASALLTFNAVALTALSVWLSYVPLNFMHLALDGVFLLMLASCGLALTIVSLKWAQRDDDPATLEALRSLRTVRYQRAWRLSAIGVAVLLVASAVHMVGTGLSATGLCGDVCQVIFSDAVLGNLDTGAA